MGRRAAHNGSILWGDRSPVVNGPTHPPPLPEPELWSVKKTILCRDKPLKLSASREIVRLAKDAARLPPGVADPQKEWYIQVTVCSGNVIHYMGEVVLPESGEQPSEELKRLVTWAHDRATFLNINGVELPS